MLFYACLLYTSPTKRRLRFWAGSRNTASRAPLSRPRGTGTAPIRTVTATANRFRVRLFKGVCIKQKGAFLQLSERLLFVRENPRRGFCFYRRRGFMSDGITGKRPPQTRRPPRRECGGGISRRRLRIPHHRPASVRRRARLSLIHI